jgi:hypothetical protein
MSKNCFCSTCKDSAQVVIAVPVKEPVKIDSFDYGNCPYWEPAPSEYHEQKLTIPCPDCSIPIDYRVIDAQPAAAE